MRDSKFVVATHEAIARLAHSLWQAEGCPAGRDREHWLQAEAGLQPPRNRHGLRA